MNIKLDLNKPLPNLDGTPIADTTIGKLLSSQLASATKGDAVKLMAWAVLLHGGSPIEVDKSDFEMLRKFVEDSPTLTNLGKAGIINEMTEQRDAAK